MICSTIIINKGGRRRLREDQNERESKIKERKNRIDKIETGDTRDTEKRVRALDNRRRSNRTR